MHSEIKQAMSEEHIAHGFCRTEGFSNTLVAAKMSRQKVGVYLHVPLIDPGRNTAQLALAPGTPGVDLPSMGQHDCVVRPYNADWVSQRTLNTIDMQD